MRRNIPPKASLFYALFDPDIIVRNQAQPVDELGA
jgi:hypothetical protein